MFNPLSIRTTPLQRAWGLAALPIFLAGALAHALEDPAPVPEQISYSKVLKGSTPEYVSVIVDSSGSALYEGRKLDEVAAPRHLQLTRATTRRIFELAAALEYFESLDLESNRKVANLGRKTFTYEDGQRKHQVEFNYTRRREAIDLMEIFESISAVVQHIATLEYAIKYDHLNLPAQLRQIQTDLNRRALTEPELMAPTLEKIASNPRFLHLAQSRAQEILEKLRSSN